MNIFKRRPKRYSSGTLTSQKSIALFLILQVILGLSFYGCKKDADHSKLDKTDVQSTISNDRIWYETFTNGKAQSVSMFDTSVSKTTFENSNLNAEKIIVDWNLATTLQTEEKTIVEAPIKGNLSFAINRGEHDKSSPNSRTSLLILTTTKKKSAYYMSVVTEPGYKEKVTYAYQPKTFTGTILYFSLQGKLLVTQVFRNGAVVGVGTPTSRTKGESKRLDGTITPLLAAPVCDIFDVYRVTTVCTPASPDVPCFTSYDYSYSFTVCNTPTAPGTGDDTPPPATGGGSGPNQPTPCFPGGSEIGPVILRLGYGVNLVNPNDPTLPPTYPGDPNPPVQPNPTFPVVPCPETPNTRINTLNSQLAINPEMLLCVDAVKFRALINERITPRALDRIQSLSSLHAGLNPYQDPYYLQKIQDASGMQVNLDRFEVNIKSLPMMGNTRMTPEAFLTYIRSNMNSFVDNGIAVFNPYVANGVNDTEDLKSGKPGSMWSIDMLNDGTVMINNSTPVSWSVSTLRSPIDFMHPVSGIRKWGYEQKADLSYVFYVSGVDRITDAITDLVSREMNDLAFQKADRLWESFQQKTSAFVNGHSGIATVGATIKQRPDWAAVRDYLNGTIDINTLRSRNGCK